MTTRVTQDLSGEICRSVPGACSHRVETLAASSNADVVALRSSRDLLACLSLFVLFFTQHPILGLEHQARPAVDPRPGYEPARPLPFPFCCRI